MADVLHEPTPTAPPGVVVRDRAWVEREYGTEKWPAVRERIAAAVAELGPTAGVAEVVGRVRAMGTASWRGQVDAVVDGARRRVDAAVVRGAHRELVVSAVLDRCRPDTRLVCELGAGWGHLLASVWASGGPLGASYVGAEFTVAGRDCIDALAAVDRRFDLRSLPFDHTQPDLSVLGSARPHAVVYTCHSVEQVGRLGEGWLDVIAGLADEVDVIHVEPVGWQTGRPGHSSLEHAERHDYNRDLLQVLGEAESARRLDIEEIALDIVGVNPANPSTVVRWRTPAAD